jgi:ribosomal protein S24E
MNLKIEKTEEKPLLARKEVAGSIMFEEKATPSNDNVRKAIAAELKVDEKVVVVKHIYTAYGSSEAKVEAYVYNDEKSLKKMEPVTKAMKLKVEAAAKKAAEAAEAPAEGAAPAEAKPAEEKKEEAKPEEKKKEAPKEEKKEEKKEAPKEEKKE